MCVTKNIIRDACLNNYKISISSHCGPSSSILILIPSGLSGSASFNRRLDLFWHLCIWIFRNCLFSFLFSLSFLLFWWRFLFLLFWLSFRLLYFRCRFILTFLFAALRSRSWFSSSLLVGLFGDNFSWIVEELIKLDAILRRFFTWFVRWFRSISLNSFLWSTATFCRRLLFLSITFVDLLSWPPASFRWWFRRSGNSLTFILRVLLSLFLLLSLELQNPFLLILDIGVMVLIE